MNWPPKTDTADAELPKLPLFRMILVTVVVGCMAFGLFRIFSTTVVSTGWATLAMIATAGYQGFTHCMSTSRRDNDGGSSPNRDAFSGPG